MHKRISHKTANRMIAWVLVTAMAIQPFPVYAEGVKAIRDTSGVQMEPVEESQILQAVPPDGASDDASVDLSAADDEISAEETPVDGESGSETGEAGLPVDNRPVSAPGKSASAETPSTELPAEDQAQKDITCTRAALSRSIHRSS